MGAIGRIKLFLRNDFESKHFFIYQLLIRIKQHPVSGLFYFLVIYAYSTYLSFQLFGFSLKPRVFFTRGIFRVVLVKSKGSKVSSDSKIAILFESFCYGNKRTCLSMSENSVLNIENTFTLGDGCQIILNRDSLLVVGGASESQGSGITSDSKIICSEKISIGSGTIFSWGCFISDSSNHKVDGVIKKYPVVIGKHVWVSEGVSIAPGSIIGDNSIVGAKSFVNGIFPSKSLIAGLPAVVKKTITGWER